MSNREFVSEVYIDPGGRITVSNLSLELIQVLLRCGLVAEDERRLESLREGRLAGCSTNRSTG